VTPHGTHRISTTVYAHSSAPRANIRTCFTSKRDRDPTPHHCPCTAHHATAPTYEHASLVTSYAAHSRITCGWWLCIEKVVHQSDERFAPHLLLVDHRRRCPSTLRSALQQWRPLTQRVGHLVCRRADLGYLALLLTAVPSCRHTQSLNCTAAPLTPTSHASAELHRPRLARLPH
jgi:hypothetical protein